MYQKRIVAQNKWSLLLSWEEVTLRIGCLVSMEVDNSILHMLAVHDRF
jgi:hypothetical protein